MGEPADEELKHWVSLLRVLCSQIGPFCSLGNYIGHWHLEKLQTVLQAVQDEQRSRAHAAKKAEDAHKMDREWRL